MAPVSDRIYFPPLEDCLGNKTFLLSWKLLAAALSDTSGRRQTSAAVVEFLANDYVHELFKSPATVFAAPNDAAKSDYETKTAAIHITPGPTDEYDIKIIKEDATWLSQTAGINLVAALRVVVAEFQARAEGHLRMPLSTKDLSNIQEAAGAGNTQIPSLLIGPGVNVAADSERILADFETELGRRKRLFATYLAERRGYMMCADYVRSVIRYQRLPSFAPVADDPIDIAKLYRLNFGPKSLTTFPSSFQTYKVAVDKAADALVSDVSLPDELLTPEFYADWARTAMTEMVHALSVIFQDLDAAGDVFAPAGVVMGWFKLMKEKAFLDFASQGLDDLVGPLKTLVAAVTLKVLTPSRAIAFLTNELEADADEDPYLMGPGVMDEVNQVIDHACAAERTVAFPSILAWCLIVHRMFVSYSERTAKRDEDEHEKSVHALNFLDASGRRSSAGSTLSIEPRPLDVFLQKSGQDKDMQSVESWAMIVTNGGRVFDIISEMALGAGDSTAGAFAPLVGSRIRTAFIDLLKASYPLLGYQSDPVTALLASISGGRRYWNITPDTVEPAEDAIAATLEDEAVLDFFLHQALGRYPYELLPFVGFSKALSSVRAKTEHDELIISLLRKTPTITLVLPDDFQQYELVLEDESVNALCILEDIPLIVPRAVRRGKTIGHDAFRIPAGTYGRFVTDSGRVVILEYEHSELALLGRRLEISLMPETYDVLLGFLTVEEVGELISLVATLLRTEYLRASEAKTLYRAAESPEKAGLELLEELSKSLSPNKDIVTVVCDILDAYLQDEAATSDGPGAVVLTSCIQFLDAILPFCPTRVWSYLARSDLLSSESQAGKLSRITGNLDLVAESYDFLTSAIRLFDHLVESAKTSAVQRKCGSQLGTRNKAGINVWLGIADNIMTKVSSAIAQAAVDVFENSSTWRFSSEFDRIVLVSEVVSVLNGLILNTYGMGDPSNVGPLTACLKPAAEYVIDSFLSAGTGYLRFKPLLATLVAGLQLPDMALYPRKIQSVQDGLTSVLGFSATLLQIANFLEKPPTGFEAQLFRVSSVLARLAAVNENIRRPVLTLLEALVVNGGKAAGDPPHLFAYISPEVTPSFLHMLAKLDKPFGLESEIKATWQFFSALVRNRQQWMVNCLLTGNTPRSALKEGDKKTNTASRSVLAIAFARLKSVKGLPAFETLAILDFVTSAQNFWPMTTFTMEKDSSFLDSLRDYVRDLLSSTIVAKTDATKASHEARAAAYVAEIFAMQLFHLRQMGKADPFAKKLVNDLDYFLRDGVTVAGYNSSLHGNFAKNFATKYPGCTLEGFKRMLLAPRDLGASYYYDLEQANEMLSFDAGWLGVRGNGFKHEMELANENLSLVDAQISLFHAWEFLLLELSSCMPKNENLAKQMLQVAQQCLTANLSSQGPEKIFVRIIEARANLSLTLVQRLIGSSPSTSDINQLLGTIFAVINNVEEPFAPESIAYFRTLLKTLYVSVRAYTLDTTKPGTDTKGAASAAVTQTMLSMLDRVVAHGFKQLVTLIHDPEASVAPEDLALLTALLQACLAMPNMDQCQDQIQNIMARHDVTQIATSLFSWADKLTTDNGDPIYGELSLLFLLELSTLPRLAEQLACDGLLGNLTSANLANFMRRAKNNISPFADGAGAQRCYSIWAKGMLPLLLNLLTALGATIAPEVSYVLNQFPHLLKASIDRFEAPGASRTSTAMNPPRHITLLSVGEIHSLALLTKVLAAFRANNERDIPEVPWDGPALLENVEFWLAGRKLLRERLLPLGQREMEWRAMKTMTSSSATGDERSENKLEERVVAQLEAVRDVLSEDLE